MNEENKQNPAETEETPEYEGILGDYTETPEEEETPAAPTSEEKAPAKKKNGSKVAAIAGISAVAALIACLGVVGVVRGVRSNQAAVSTAHFKVTEKGMACALQGTLDMYKNYFGEDYLASNYGLDVNAPLKDQASPVEDFETWFDLLISDAKQTISAQLVLAEAANAAGFEMSDEDRQEMENAVAAIDLSTYGYGITEADLREAMELEFYSSAYYDAKMAEDVDDADVEAYADAAGNTYKTCGVMGFSAIYDTEDDGSGDMITQDSAKEWADKFAACKTPEELRKKAKEYLEKEMDYSEEDAAATVSTIENPNFAYSEGNELCEWAFGGAKVNDIYTIEDDGAYYVYMLTSEPVRDDSKTVNVRHILFSLNPSSGEESRTMDECRQLAEDCLEEWKNGEATEDSFAALATEKTDDTGSASTGGLYENVYIGQMVASFEEWCFDENRKPGDTGIVESDYGVHVMYFVSDDEPTWKLNAASDLKSERYEEWYNEQVELYPVTFHDDVINSIGD